MNELKQSSILSDTSSSDSVLSEQNTSQSSNSSSIAFTLPTSDIVSSKSMPALLFNGSINAPSQHKMKIISDANEIDKYLDNERNGQRQSALGIADVDTWNDDVSNENMDKVRSAIVRQANEPIVQPKDEWDICLDSGAAFPHKVRRKSNPFQDFDRNSYANQFQKIQSKGEIETERKKKALVHNKRRFHSRRQRHAA